MKERVGKLVKGSAARGLTVSTFHNLGLNIIRKELKHVGYKSGFTIFGAEDAGEQTWALVYERYNKALRSNINNNFSSALERPNISSQD